MRLLGEDLSRMIREMKVNLSAEDKLSLDGQYGRIEDQSLKDLGSNRSSMGTETYQKQGRKKETKMEGIYWKVTENNGSKQRLLEKAKRVKQKLQMTPGGDKTISRMGKKQMKQKLNGSIDTDETNQIRQWFLWPVER